MIKSTNLFYILVLLASNFNVYGSHGSFDGKHLQDRQAQSATDGGCSCLDVGHGGTGTHSFTAFTLLTSGITSTTPLRSLDSGIAGQVLTSNGASAVPSFQPAAVSGIATLAGNSGSATGATVTIAGGNNITTSGAGSTLTVNVSGTTDHCVQVGNASGSLTSVSPGLSGIPFIGQGALADPLFGTAIVAGGGTGVTSLTAHGVLIGQGSSAISTTVEGATNTVLLGNSGADPSFGQVSNAALVNSFMSLNNGNNITVTG